MEGDYSSTGEQYSDTRYGVYSTGFGIAEESLELGRKPCVSRNGCKLGDGRKLKGPDGVCGVCGGKVRR